MQSVWTANIKDPDEKAKYESELLRSRWVLNREREILDGMERGLDRQELSPQAYDSPNWDYRAAHTNGWRQCLNQIREIITLDHKDNNERKLTRSAGRPS